jgi:ribosome-binding protein aMBF1 (putative translation factor)
MTASNLEQLIAARAAARTEDEPYDPKVVEEQIAADVGEAIRQLRVNLGLNQSQLAGLMGTSQPTITRIESGRVLPGLGTQARILRALGVEHLHFDLMPDGISIDVRKALRSQQAAG